MKTIYATRNRWFTIYRPVLWVLIVTMAMISYGCLATWGHLSFSDEAQTAFAENRFPDGYNYYYLGFDNDPDALLGLDTGYVLTKSFWKPVDPDVDDMNKMVAGMQFFDCIHRGYDPHSFDGQRELTGFAIKDPDNKTIGILYSCYDWFPVKFHPDKRISVYPPQTFDMHAIWYND